MAEELAPIEVEWDADDFKKLLDEAKAAGYRQAITDLRDEARRLNGLVDDGHPLGNAAVALHVDAAADFLASRLSTEGSTDDRD